MTIAALIRQCGETAKSKGFWDSHKEKAAKVLDDRGFGEESIKIIVEALSEELILGDPTIFLALMMTELGEAVEAVRKDNYRGKDGALEEIADTFIRGFDFIDRFSRLMGSSPEEFADILVKKMEFNKTRLPLHGKKF